MENLVYKEQLIRVDGNKCYVYLFNADGDIEEYPINIIDAAKDFIDKRIETNGGYYNSDGSLTYI